jgi:hypothetical protein
MTTPTQGGALTMPTYEFTTEDLEYLRHEGKVVRENDPTRITYRAA